MDKNRAAQLEKIADDRLTVVLGIACKVLKIAHKVNNGVDGRLAIWGDPDPN
jgi:hypothetical protein